MPTVMVTGANRGIGLELCTEFKARGYDVVGVCRNSSPELDGLGVRVEDGVDVTDPDSLRGLADRLGDLHLDVLLHNAGVLSREQFGDIDASAIEAIERQFRVNAIGPLLTVQALRHNLREGSKVGIVTSRVGSIEDNTSGGNYGYRMSKAAANMVGRNLTHDLKPHGVMVMLLHPGYVRTEMTGNQGKIEPDEAARGLVDRIEECHMGITGTFWHANGEQLPW